MEIKFWIEQKFINKQYWDFILIGGTCKNNYLIIYVEKCKLLNFDSEYDIKLINKFISPEFYFKNGEVKRYEGLYSK